MPRRQTPAQVVRDYLAPITAAVRCIAPGTLLTSSERSFEIGREYAVVLNNADPLRLKASPAIYLSMGQKFRIEPEETVSQRQYRVQANEYWYQFALDNNVEILAFHWTPHVSQAGQTTYPHLHIGSAMLSDNSPVFPGTFHKKHLPTGRVSVQSVVRFAIEELDVSPPRQDWIAILQSGQDRFG